MGTLENVRGFNRIDYPPLEEVNEARKVLKPCGVLSKAYNKHELKKVERESVIAKSHPLGSSSKEKMTQSDVLKPGDPDGAVTYFKSKTKHEIPRVYDRVKNVHDGYDQRLHRDDREHYKSKGLSVNAEEISTAVPLLSSSVYGHPRRKPLEFPSRKHGHVEVCQKDFLRLTGVNLAGDE